MLSPLRCNDSLCTRIPERCEYDICSLDIDAGVGRIQNTGCGVVSEAAEQEDVVDYIYRITLHRYTFRHENSPLYLSGLGCSSSSQCPGASLISCLTSSSISPPDIDCLM